MKKLPIGISTLADFITDGYVYVDKTPYVQMLTERGKYYFLSRPRRFGKSLLVDTLHQLFAGNEPLFRACTSTRIGIGQCNTRSFPSASVRGQLTKPGGTGRAYPAILRLNQAAPRYCLCRHEDVAGCFSELIRAAKAKYGRSVVVLVDEYDKPILDNITKPDDGG